MSLRKAKRKEIPQPTRPNGRPSKRQRQRRATVGAFLLQVTNPDRLRQATILEANGQAAEFSGANSASMRGRTLATLPVFSRLETLEKCQRAFQTGETVEISPWNGVSHDPLRMRVLPLGAHQAILTLEDGTAHAAVEQKIRRSEESLHLLIQGVKDYAIFMLDPTGRVLSWNEGAERLKGYRADEVIGKNYALFFTPEDRKSGKPAAELERAAREGQAEEEGWLIRKDGWAFWANTVITALRDDEGRLYGFAKITRDMTERREREESIRVLNEHLEQRIEQRTAELIRLNQTLQSEVQERLKAEQRLRALSARQERVREDERARLAREIHDALGQICTALKMDISWIAKNLPRTERPLTAKAKAALQLVGDLIQSLRRLSTELRPSTLDTLGLVAAIEWQAQQFQAHTGIRCTVHLPDKDLTLEPDRATAIFRIFQETLTNVTRHANASEVKTNLFTTDSEITLVTHDNGKGFQAEFAEHQGSLGLLGMRERAHLLGGEAEIESAPGRGTTVLVHIPLTAT